MSKFGRAITKSNIKMSILKIIENKDKVEDSMTYDLLLVCIENYNNTIK